MFKMKFASGLLVLACVAISVVNCASSEEAVVALTQSTFDAFINKHDYVLAEFYAPWCGHCKKLAPEYEGAAKELKDKKSDVALVKIDATKETELGTKFGVTGYPTLKFFRKGVPEEYHGGRTKDTILQWLKKQTAPAVAFVTSVAEAEKIAEEENIVFLGTVASKESDSYKLFERVANKSREHGSFVALVAGDTKKDTVTVIRKDEGHAATEDLTTEDALTKFCKDEKLPYFGPISGDNYAAYFASPAHMIWFAGGKEQYTKVGSTIREVAKDKDITGKFRFVWLDTDQYSGHAENALAVKKFPALVMQTKKARFIFPGETFDDSKAIKQFLLDAEAGKIERSFKSEPIPEKNDEDVKVVVGNNFEKLVLQKDKDVLLEIYAPWCGHCKKFEPIYKEFAAAMKSVSHLVVAKMDGTANEAPVENFSFSGFPTVFFVKAGTDKPIPFEGARTAAGLLEFLKKHASKPIDVTLKDEL